MLLNEFLKEHRTVQKQGATIAQLKSMVQKQEAANVQQQKQIEALTAGLRKVSAQLEASKLRRKWSTISKAASGSLTHPRRHYGRVETGRRSRGIGEGGASLL
jgi:hypothetical protein